MKILAIQISTAPRSHGEAAIPLAVAQDLSSFSFFQQSSIGEFLTFFSNTVAERTDLGQMRSVQENNYTAHVYARSRDQLTGCIITDDEYPTRVAFSLINKLLDDFSERVPESKWRAASEAARAKGKATKADGIDFPQIKDYLAKYQDPKQADNIMKIQQELDETKIILNKTIESVLERGEKLDTLVDKSNALSMQSKMFYKTAKKQNSCCVIS